MAHQWTVREGSIEPLVFVLYDGDDVYDLSGILALEIRLNPQGAGSTLTFTTVDAELAVTDATGGEVTFYPAADTLDFAAAPYDVYFWVTDGNSYKISFPHDGAFSLRMIDNP